MRNPFFQRLKAPAQYGRVMVAKTTHLGDLVISLPLASALKLHDPSCTVIYLTNRATAAVAKYCPDIDEVYAEPDSTEGLSALLRELKIDVFINVNAASNLAKAAFLAKVPRRIGSLFRLYNFRYCTDLVAISRPEAKLNKRQLDLEYLVPLGIHTSSMQDVAALVQRSRPRIGPTTQSINPRRFSGSKNAIVLSASLVTARTHQWPMARFSCLIRALDPNRFHWFICGVESERAGLLPLLTAHAGDSNVTDMVGKLSLDEFVSFTSRCDGLIAGSTGPLHLAAALGIHTLGLFASNLSDIRRWGPIGPRAAVIHSHSQCERSRFWQRDVSGTCPCIVAIQPATVAAKVEAWRA